MSQRKNIAGKTRRHGVSLIYVTVFMFVLLGFCMLAVDMSRVQVAKTQLETATDAAARAAVANLPTSISASRAAAYDTAQMNTADAAPVTIDSLNNVVFLNWPSTTPLTGSALASANAVQVTASLSVPMLFGEAIGADSCVVHATSVAQYNPTPPASFPITGVNGVDLGSPTDSYNSSNGSYSSQTPGSHGSIGSNGTININAPVCGNVHYCGCSPCVGCSGSISGKQTPIAAPICPVIPTVPGGCTNLGTVSIGGSCSGGCGSGGSNTLTLTSGNYCCSSVSVGSGATLNIDASSGPVNLYVCGSVDLNGGTVTTSGNIPDNCHINVTNSSPVNLYDGTGNCYAVINAPLSNVTMQGNTQLFGSVMSNTLQTSAGTSIHYDQALGGGGPATGTVCQVK